MKFQQNYKKIESDLIKLTVNHSIKLSIIKFNNEVKSLNKSFAQIMIYTYIKAIKLKATWGAKEGVGCGCLIDIAKLCIEKFESEKYNGNADGYSNYQVFTANVNHLSELMLVDQIHEYPPHPWECNRRNINPVASWLSRGALFDDVWLVPYNFEDDHLKLMMKYFIETFAEDVSPVENVIIGDLLKLTTAQRVPKRLRSGSFDNY